MLPPVGMPVPQSGIAYGSECIESKRSLVLQREGESTLSVYFFVFFCSFSCFVLSFKFCLFVFRDIIN